MKHAFFFILITGLFFIQTSCRQKKEKSQAEKDARSTIIRASEINEKIKNGEDVIYQYVTIVGDIDFNLSEDKSILYPNIVQDKIKSAVLFSDCTFKGKISAYKKADKVTHYAKFTDNFVMINCTVQDSVNFRETDFYGIVNIQNTIFSELVSFEGAYFDYRKNYFNDSEFIKKCNFNRADFRGKVSFFQSEIGGQALFQKAHFGGEAVFGAVKCNDYAAFSMIKSDDALLFNYAEFAEKADFGNSVFGLRTEFIGCKFDSVINISGSTFRGRVLFDNALVNSELNLAECNFYGGLPSLETLVYQDDTELKFENIRVLLAKKTELNTLKNQ